MKRIIGILLTITMIISIFPANVLAAKTSFPDVDSWDYYAEAAETLAKAGILTGYPDGTFGPDLTIVRSEMAAIVCRMIGKEKEAEKAKGKTNYKDVASNYWASGYINIATKEGIIKGDEHGFRPEDPVLFEEAVKMIVCALGLGDDVKIENPKKWWLGYFEVAEEAGIMKDLQGKAGKNAYRADVAVMAYNGISGNVEAPVPSLNPGTYSGSKSVKLSTATKDAVIYYTLDGSTPTVKSTRYTKALTFSNNVTLKAIAVKNGVIKSDVMTARYNIRRHSSKAPTVDQIPGLKHKVEFNLNYENAPQVEAQEVLRGECAVVIADPERTGYAFGGWYEDDTYEVKFDFAAPIKKNYNLVARWIDALDTTDTDSDGLTDPFEEYYGTDKENHDTDGDRLSDRTEVIVGTDPLKTDTDENGILDTDEDADLDGLTNIEEIQAGTNPLEADTDWDGLNDKEEIETYLTDPNNADTDSDGISDGTEVEFGTNPISPEQIDMGENKNLAVFFKAIRDPKNDAVYKVTFVQGGEEITLITDVDCENKDDFFDDTIFGRGDIFVYSTNDAGNIDKFEIVADIDSLSASDTAMYGEKVDITKPDVQYEFAFVTDKDAVRRILTLAKIASVTDGVAEMDSYTWKRVVDDEAAFTIVDLYRSKHSVARVQASSIAEIQRLTLLDGKLANEDSDVAVFLKYYFGRVIDVIIIKGLAANNFGVTFVE